MCEFSQLRDAGREETYKTLSMDKSQSHRYIVANNHNIWVQQSPILRTGRIEELESEALFLEADIEEEGLVAISKKGDGPLGCAAL